MKLYNVLFNNKIPFVLLENDDSDNVIYCNSFEDHLFNIGTFGTKTKEIMLEYSLNQDEKYVVVDVTFEDGKCYEGVLFKIVVSEDKELPYSTFNPALLDINRLSKVEFVDDKVDEKIELIETKNIEPVIEENFIHIEEKKKQYEELINSALQTEQKLLEEKRILDKQKIILEKQNIIEDKVQKIKSELLEEYFNAVKKQEEILNTSIDKKLASLEDRLIQTLERYSDQYADKAEELKTNTKDFIRDQEINILNNLSQKIENKIEEQKKEIETLIGSELSYTQAEVVSKLEETSQKLVELYKDKTVVMLEQYKQDLFEQYSTVAQQKADEFFSKKSKAISSELKKLTESIEELQLLKDVKKEVIKEVKQYVDEASQSARAYARRILELGGGGGSVAVQYAEGGTMNGDLTVKGKITTKSLVIDDGVTVCGNILPCQTDTYNLGSSALRWKDLHLAGNSLYIGDSIITAIGTTIVIPSQKVDGNVTVLGGDVEVTDGNYLSAGINLLDIFGSGQSSTVVAGNSAKWDSTYTTVNLNSATWATYSYVQSNYLNLTGGTVDGNLTITGNLTALGTSSFVNTVFSTTSALSVVNTGIGPALYVFQAAGPYDVASFFDGDGVEVLHVGNAQPGGLGRVGINTSFPTTELTVNGSISSNGSITVLGGDSNQWNSVYSSTSQTSGNWDSVYTSIQNNSGEWESVYNSWNELSGIYVTTHYLSTNNVLLSAATVTDDINVGGTGYFNHVAAASKSFYIKHPSKPGMHLQYGSLESPYHGIRLTGRSKLKKQVKIYLPSYIKDLVKEGDANVQLTNINHTKILYVSDINLAENYFIVNRNHNMFNKHKEYEFFWTFTAIRKDIPDLQVEMP